MIDIGFNLDCILEEAQDNLNPSVACNTYKKLLEAKTTLRQLQKQLYIETKRLCLESAIAIRRENPAFNVAVDDTTLKIGYRQDWMILQPNYDKQSWELINSSQNMRHIFAESLIGKNDLTQSSVDWSRNLVKCFGNVDGTGIVMLEGKRTTLIDLCAARNDLLPLKLPSRRSRGR